MSIIFHFMRRLTAHWARSELATAGAMLIFLVVLGTVGYAILEGWSWLDALYATIITITTVGYGDLTPSTAMGRIFAIFFTLIAIGIGGYGISAIAAYVIESRLERKAKSLRKQRMKQIEALQNHYIICGADLLGTRIAGEFQQAQAQFILIDSDEARLKQAIMFTNPEYTQQKVKTMVDFVEIDLSEYEELSLEELSYKLDTPYLLDDPTDDTVLAKAGIGRAAGLIAAMPDKRDNLAIVVGARALGKRFDNPNLRIMARLEDGGYMRKMYLSGADVVRIPALMSGVEMATHMLHPEIGNWWYTLVGADARTQDTAHLQQINLANQPGWVGKTVADLHKGHNIVTVAVKRDDKFITPPPADLTLQADDVLISISTEAV